MIAPPTASLRSPRYRMDCLRPWALLLRGLRPSPIDTVQIPRVI
ncbi:Protein of unknown function [Pyronema omphalodes CBS 100304]|uniref:Uncharacterized protein n=1 Tax=Pyronema omphalodes (strain CBS 100304) TaxID=1076935 RepID=U4L0S4_PYROM|nr:Protein of unknown function [Pyronema omphalodes CBS 100304]